MLWAGSKGGLEVRTSADGATRLRGRFPYSVPTVLRDGREPRREVFEARAFGASVADGGDIHLLVHHDFDRPLASRAAGSLEDRDGHDALTFEATIAPEMQMVGYVKDILGALAAGLVGGISPGFRVPDGGDYRSARQALQGNLPGSAGRDATRHDPLGQARPGQVD